MANVASSSSSSCASSSPAVHPKKYDVFISFRGEDTRTNFTSHLYTALCEKGFRTYIDYELPRGDEIKHSLMQAIENCSISVVVFSENYANSKWCLNELLKIIECKRDQGQTVIPVFYKVDPSHVRHQEGTFKDAFAKHETNSMLDQQILNKWKHALTEIANLSGWDSRTCRNESEFIRDIVNNIFQHMKLVGHATTSKGIVGMNENCDNIEMLLKEAQIIGIWGMGGIGKTTMARTVFTKLASQFEGCCFLENIREETERHGLRYLRDKLLLELLKEDYIYHNTHHVVESAFAVRRLGSKKVFVVLDDVNCLSQVHYFTTYYDCLGHGSRVIITTRNRHLLIRSKVDKIYEAKPLSYFKSLQLFNVNAFLKDHSEIGFEQLSRRAVDYARGIPLVLIVLGSFLHSRTSKEWNSTLLRLEKTPDQYIQGVLKLSYDGLNDEEKEIFLDIACFLNGETEGDVTTLLDSCGFHASIGLRTLVDNGLITIDRSFVRMHDLIKQMGYEIVRQESIKEPGRRSRLCDHEEIYSVLKCNMGTSAIEGIILNLSLVRDLSLTADTFQKMSKLRFLKFYSSGYNNLSLPFGLESLPMTLRYFQWDGYPLKSLPSTFSPEKLVELNMRDSRLVKLWDGVQDFVNLRRINLGGSKQLIELPDFSKAQNLEGIYLTSCQNLCYVHSSILSLQKLVILNLIGCKSLKELKSETHLKSLQSLGVTGCYSLMEFSLSSEEIERLDLGTSSIEILGSSIGRLCKLKRLELDGSRLQNLPIEQLCYLRSLKHLTLTNCKLVIDKLKLHILFEALQSLCELKLDGCSNLTELPDNIKNLSRLKSLSLRNCTRLRSVPKLPQYVKHLHATGCTSLESFPVSHANFEVLSFNVSNLKKFSIDQLCCSRRLREFTLLDCGQLIDKSKLRILFDGQLCCLEILHMEGCSNLYELPDNVSALSSLTSLRLEGSNVESLPATIKHLSRLKCIDLTNCRRLQSMPQLPQSMKYVKASNCTSLDPASLLTSIAQGKYRVKSIFLQNCLKMNEHSHSCIEEQAFFSLKRDVYMHGDYTYPGFDEWPCLGTICYPESRVPSWFRYNQTKKASSSITITIELSSHFNNLLGFVFCCVLQQFSSKQDFPSYLLCQYNFEDGRFKSSSTRVIEENMNSGHVFMWTFLFHFPEAFFKMVTFEFSVVTKSANNKRTKRHDQLIEACGVCPIYASEYHNFLQQMEMKLERGIKICRGWAINELSLHGALAYANFLLKPTKHDNLKTSIISRSESVIPEWFTYKGSMTEHFVFVDLSPDLDYLLGFIFCFVIPQFSSEEQNRIESRCQCRYGDYTIAEGAFGWHYSVTELSSSNIFIWYDPLLCELIIEKLRGLRHIVKERTRLSFQFRLGKGLIKECGVRPIYASEYNDFLHQMDIKLDWGRKTKRPRDTDDEEQYLTPTKKLKEYSSKSMSSQNIHELQLSLSKLKLESSHNT